MNKKALHKMATATIAIATVMPASYVGYASEVEEVGTISSTTEQETQTSGNSSEQLLVKYKDTAIATFSVNPLEEVVGEVIDQDGSLTLYEVPESETDSIIEKLEAMPNVEYVERKRSIYNRSRYG